MIAGPLQPVSLLPYSLPRPTEVVRRNGACKLLATFNDLLTRAINVLGIVVTSISLSLSLMKNGMLISSFLVVAAICSFVRDENGILHRFGRSLGLGKRSFQANGV